MIYRDKTYRNTFTLKNDPHKHVHISSLRETLVSCFFSLVARL